MFEGHDPYLVALSVGVGVSLFFVRIGEPSLLRVASSAALLGIGIVSMHYVGMHALMGHFTMEHDSTMVVLSVLIAVGAAYGGLRAFLARHDGIRLTLSAIAFGIAVSGMHYTAMFGTHIVAGAAASHHQADGLVASQQVLSLVVALLCFVIAAGFLLSLVPDSRRKAATSPDITDSIPRVAPVIADVPASETDPIAIASPRLKPAPLGGLGQPRAVPVPRLPIEGVDGTHFIEIADVRSIRADAHYTRVHDGARERMSPWSISEAEAQLDPDQFVRVHRSYIVALAHVTFVRKEGDGAVVELGGPSSHRVPVSRAKIAELKARLGLVKRSAPIS